MARRTPEEVLAQREAWLARKTARESGQDVPMMPPLYPGEEPPEDVEASEVSAEEAEEATEAQETAPVDEAPVEEKAAPEPEPEPAQESQVGAPESPPGGKRTKEEILAQREAWLARKAARESGQAPPPEPTPEPEAPKPAEAPAPAETPKPKPKPKAAPQPKKPKAAPEPEPDDSTITRRELLNYAWLASIGLFTVQTIGLSLWFAFPNFKEGDFGGLFPIGTASSVLPEPNSPPIPFTDGKFWLVNMDELEGPNGEPHTGVLAIYKVCTHLGCLYEWITTTFRFECPCHGSKFALTGDYIAGPARRSLDRFVIQAVAPDGSIRAQTNEDGEPLIVQPDDTLVIDTGARILGSSDIIPA